VKKTDQITALNLIEIKKNPSNSKYSDAVYSSSGAKSWIKVQKTVEKIYLFFM
jgi:hypothetical protein